MSLTATYEMCIHGIVLSKHCGACEFVYFCPVCLSDDLADHTSNRDTEVSYYCRCCHSDFCEKDAIKVRKE